MSHYPFYVKPAQLTRSDQLREQLAQLEALVGQLGHGLGEEALTLPALFDQVATGLTELQATGQGMQSETARLKAASAELQRKAGIFLREIGGVETLREVRSARQPDPAYWWWFLDQMLAERRRVQLRRLLLGGGVAVLLLALLSFAYQRFFAPSPALVASMRHQQAAERLAQAGDWAGAIGEVEQALAAMPNDPDGLVLKGVLQQSLGQNESARETFSAAEVQLGNKEDFLITRARQFMKLGQAEAALADAQAAISLNADSAVGYLFLGEANVTLKNYPEAITALQRASELAEAQNELTIAASARAQLGVLLQMVPVQATVTP